MALYESVFLTRQEVPQQQVESAADSFAEIITGGGGVITKREYWGLRTLSYRIKKSRKAHYTHFNIDSPPDAVKEMERQMSLDEDVLRCLTIRCEELDKNPSILAQTDSQPKDSSNEQEYTARTKVVQTEETSDKETSVPKAVENTEIQTDADHQDNGPKKNDEA